MSAPFGSVSFGPEGDIVSLRIGERDVMPADDFAGFVLRADTPAEYDNWDIDMADADRTGEHVACTAPPRVVENGALRTVVEYGYATDRSRWTVRWSVLPDRIDAELRADWHEDETRLQWRMPTDIHAREAVCGTQFGHVRRARHGNTSWDHARFEVCAHRYVAVSEPGFGVALVADGPRGYDVRNDAIALTVLRSPRFPDPLADRGSQHITWSVAGLAGDPAYEDFELRVENILNPPRVVYGEPVLPRALLDWDGKGNVQVSAVKPADDGSGDVIVRMWQTNGSRSVARFDTLPYERAVHCDALEEPTGEPVETEGRGMLTVRLDPFGIVTVRLTDRRD